MQRKRQKHGRAQSSGAVKLIFYGIGVRKRGNGAHKNWRKCAWCASGHALVEEIAAELQAEDAGIRLLRAELAELEKARDEIIAYTKALEYKLT